MFYRAVARQTIIEKPDDCEAFLRVLRGNVADRAAADLLPGGRPQKKGESMAAYFVHFHYRFHFLPLFFAGDEGCEADLVIGSIGASANSALLRHERPAASW